jgi:hypothetical protein
VRRVTAPIRREMRRRAAVEPVIGHIKAEHRMDRNYLKGRNGDRCNAVLAAAGYNFSLLLRWLERLLRALMRILLATPATNPNRLTNAPHRFFTDDLGYLRYRGKEMRLLPLFIAVRVLVPLLHGRQLGAEEFLHRIVSYFRIQCS